MTIFAYSPTKYTSTIVCCCTALLQLLSTRIDPDCFEIVVIYFLSHIFSPKSLAQKKICSVILFISKDFFCLYFKYTFYNKLCEKNIISVRCVCKRTMYANRNSCVMNKWHNTNTFIHFNATMFVNEFVFHIQAIQLAQPLYTAVNVIYLHIIIRPCGMIVHHDTNIIIIIVNCNKFHEQHCLI